MKRLTALVLTATLIASLAGCRLPGMEEDLYRKDTVIYIPADPTTEATEPTTEVMEPETTETYTKPTVKLPTASADQSNSGNKSSGPSDKTSSSGSPGKPSTKETEAATLATVPPTDPAETEYQIYDISDYLVGYLESSMMDQVNSHRRDAGLTELQKSDRLSAIASVRAYECCLSWSHTRPDGSDYTTVLQDYGFSAGIAGENLLYTSGNEDGATLVSKWMNAETNRDNLLYDGFTTMGIGVYEANGYVYIACLLAG